MAPGLTVSYVVGDSWWVYTWDLCRNESTPKGDWNHTSCIPCDLSLLHALRNNPHFMSHNPSSGSCMPYDASPDSCMQLDLSSSWSTRGRTYLVWLTSPSCSIKERSMSSRPNWTWNPNWLLPVTFTWWRSNDVNLFTHWSFQWRVYLSHVPTSLPLKMNVKSMSIKRRLFRELLWSID